ncbi:lactococcin 972 family bacteriocin [Streptomyces sp. NPDC102451]|uniref:lactococcin 972 family bacteriocin n=1 Tax=Streptomyces sp. NPDC102451 TaxID=3366177 RepID=UPI0037F2083E
MKKFGRSIALGFATVALAAFGLAAPAVAQSPQSATVTADGAIITQDGAKVGQITTHTRGDGSEPPAELGDPSEWGVVAIEMNDSPGTVKPMVEACTNPPSGGKWCYGWYSVSKGKHCYSNYLHETKSHRATVKINNVTKASGASPGNVAQAWLEAGAAYTCYTYYSIA